MFARLFQQHQHAVDIGLNEGSRFHQRAVDVCLGGEINDHIDAIAVCFGNVGRIRDVSVNETVILVAFVFREILANASVGQLVEIHDAGVASILAEDEADEIRSDETGTAGDEITHAFAVYIQFRAMKSLILGATGLTGRPLVRQALDAGHSVAALVRDPRKVTDSIEVVQSDATNSSAVAGAVRGRDAVLSALGTSKSFK